MVKIIKNAFTHKNTTRQEHDTRRTPENDYCDGKRCVFNNFLKTLTDGEKRISLGSEFQRHGPATLKAWSPTERSVRGTSRKLYSFTGAKISSRLVMSMKRRQVRRSETLHSFESQQ